MPKRKSINCNLCLSQCHWRHYEYPKIELIVPTMALMEAQVVILYIFYVYTVNRHSLGKEKMSEEKIVGLSRST